jgi:hypothetical protein
VAQDRVDQLIGNAAASTVAAAGTTGVSRWLALRLPYSAVDGLAYLGVTDAFGNISVDSSLEGQELRQTLLHEAVHSIYTRVVGVDISQATYANRFGQVLEEWVAETFATGQPITSLRLALSYPPVT